MLNTRRARWSNTGIGTAPGGLVKREEVTQYIGIVLWEDGEIVRNFGSDTHVTLLTPRGPVIAPASEIELSEE